MFCDYDENGICRNCGGRNHKWDLIQSVEFINDVAIRSGDTLRMPPVILGPDGLPARGTFYAEIKKMSSTEYEGRIIGQG